MLKQKKKYMSVVLVTFLVASILFNTVIAVGFNPSGGNSGDDETYKEYTAKLLDFQFNTIMALNLDDEFGMDMETPITMLGAIQLHHVKDSQVELLENEPTLELVNENGNICATTEIYNMPNTDTYYFDIYDLNVNNNDQYKLLISFTDNYGNEIEKYVTYDGSMFISQHQRGTMTYKSLNNIAVIQFDLDSSDNLDTQNIVKGDMNKNGIIDENDLTQILDIVRSKEEVTPEILEIADMNGDGKISLVDYTRALAAVKNLKGDMNKNGIIDEDDASQILEIVKSNEQPASEILKIADINEDGKVTLADYTRVLVITKAKNGDINIDGIVDSADAAIALNLYKYNNATAVDIQIGDMDANGILDSADAAMILNTYKYGK